MAIVKVHGVPLIPQPSDGVCWYVSARMCYKWSKANGRSMKNPADDEGMHTRFENNGDWDSSQNGILATTFNMQKFNGLSIDFDSLNYFFSQHGPIWTAVQKNWNGNNFGHVVVMCGISDTGVFINDPWPVGHGEQKWLTWNQINKAIDGYPGGDFQFLTAG